ncbi:hypothetical protein ACQ4M4_25815 [Leptolyngbya sp. AN02str]|uniref:hypothetical protein n=1 Tax=Leptolyngbya sp. AN02str TaxID=3423363 RepID=UPI003D312E94
MPSRQTSNHQPKSQQSTHQFYTALASRPFAQSAPQEPLLQPQTALQGSNPLTHISIVDPDPSPQLPIQPKLTIGAVGDKYEQEADRVAHQVVQRINAPQTPNEQPIQRQEKIEEDNLQMKPLLQCRGNLGGIAAPLELESSIQRLRGQGQPLSDQIREPMEQAFGGVDFRGDPQRQLRQLRRAQFQMRKSPRSLSMSPLWPSS